MNRFVSTYTMRLDAKGRISIPASYRAVIARDGFEGLYCHPAIDRPALDAGGHALLADKPDFVVDAIDNIKAKCHLIATCRARSHFICHRRA